MAAVPGILRRWNPGILPGINVWLDSSDRATINSNTEGKINSIVDKTANNTVLTQPNTANKPSVGVDSGGRNILRFGNNLFLQTSNFPFNGPTSNFINVNVFTVDTYVSGEENHLYFLSNINTNFGLSVTQNTITSTTLQIDTRNCNTNITTLKYNSNRRDLENLNILINDPRTDTGFNNTGLNINNSLNNFTLGRTFESTETTPFFFKGSMSEMVFYNQPNLNLQPLEGYLSWKWGLQGYLSNTHPYKYRPPN